MNDVFTYKYFYKNLSGEVQAATSYAAQQAAQAKLKLKDKERSKITVILAAKNGQEVTHHPEIL